jgi:hypothetical protein
VEGASEATGPFTSGRKMFYSGVKLPPPCCAALLTHIPQLQSQSLSYLQLRETKKVLFPFPKKIASIHRSDLLAVSRVILM